MNFDMTTPCKDCPFRSDVKPYLRPDRVKGILKALLDDQQTFTCHKTIGKNPSHCAGAMILLERLNRPNQMMRIMERLHAYDRRKLCMDAPVYTTPKEMVDAYKQASRKGRNEGA